MSHFLQILIQSVCETMVPKLVAEDIPLLFSLLSDVFPGVQYHRGEMTALREELKKVCSEMYLTYGDGDDVGSMWVEKVRSCLISSWLQKVPNNIRINFHSIQVTFLKLGYLTSSRCSSCTRSPRSTMA